MFLQWFTSELLSRACTCFCDVHYRYLAAEVITGNAFLYEENDDVREVFFLMIYLLIFFPFFWHWQNWLFQLRMCSELFRKPWYCWVWQYGYIHFIMIWESAALQKRRCRNRCVCFHAKNANKIISARGEFQRTDRLCHLSPTEFQ